MTEIILIGACVVLVLLPPKWDPAIRLKEWLGSEGKPSARPPCYGDWPHYSGQEAAERDCANCQHGMDCFEETPYRHRKD